MTNDFRLANIEEVDRIVSLSGKVQDALTDSGSLQEIGPLRHDAVGMAVREQRCFVVVQGDSLIGCALLKCDITSSDIFQGTEHSNEPQAAIRPYPRRWLYLHSIMLDPLAQGHGIGLRFVNWIIAHLSQNEAYAGTVFLDCWEGNEKLRDFYRRVGFSFVQIIPEKDYRVALFAMPIIRTDQ